jgi:hypothetical protein
VGDRLPAEKVKNAQPLRYTLLPESGRLIEDYLALWQHRGCGHGVPWLFPERDGGHIDRKVLSESIAKRARRYVGARITAHQFRHLAAKLYLRVDGSVYSVKLSATETKTGPPYVAAVPPEPTPSTDGWLQVHRASLQLIATKKAQVSGVGGHLWLNRWGRPMHSAAIRHQIEIRTKEAFGKTIWPHLFRDCAVTELVDCAPEEIGIAPDLLGMPTSRLPNGIISKRSGCRHTRECRR